MPCITKNKTHTKNAPTRRVNPNNPIKTTACIRPVMNRPRFYLARSFQKSEPIESDTNVLYTLWLFYRSILIFINKLQFLWRQMSWLDLKASKMKHKIQFLPRYPSQKALSQCDWHILSHGLYWVEDNSTSSTFHHFFLLLTTFCKHSCLRSNVLSNIKFDSHSHLRQ